MFRYVRLRVPNTSPPQYTYVYFSGLSDGAINQQIKALQAETDIEMGGGGYTIDKSYTSAKTQKDAYENMQSEATVEFEKTPTSPAAYAFPNYTISDESGAEGMNFPNFPSFQDAGNKIGEGFPTILGQPSSMALSEEEKRRLEARKTWEEAGPAEQEFGDRFRPGVAPEDADRDLATGFQRFMRNLFPDTGGTAPTEAVREAADATFSGLRNLYNIQTGVTRNPLFQYAGQQLLPDPSFGQFVQNYQAQRAGGGMTPGLGLAQGLGNISSLLGSGMGITSEMPGYTLLTPFTNPETTQQAAQVGNLLGSLIQQLNMPSGIARSVASRINPLQLMGRYQVENPDQNFLDYAAQQLGLAGFLRPTVQAGQTLQPFGGNIGIGE